MSKKKAKKKNDRKHQKILEKYELSHHSDERSFTEAQTLITKEIENISKSPEFERFNLDTNSNNLSSFYAKQEELKALISILHLSNLSDEQIVHDRLIKEKVQRKGSKISDTLISLKKYFKDGPFFQDLINIEEKLKEIGKTSQKRRLAMILTDNPQTLWQVGKYPIGCGSCQNYDGGSHANQLMGYVGDANCKAVYVFDLNQLPTELREKLEKDGFEAIKDKLLANDILKSSIARSMIKIAKDEVTGKPVIVMEPTYSRVNKRDKNMDTFFDIFLDISVANSMKVKKVRSSGNVSVRVGNSRSPEGQYEDLNLSSMHYVDQNSIKAKDSKDIADRLRVSI